MRKLRDILDKLRPAFGPEGRFHAAKPVFDAAENFFFSPDTSAQRAPFVRDPLDIKRYMSMVIVAIAPCVVASLYFYGLRVLAMIIVSYAVGGTVEVLFAVIRKEEINEGFLVTGLVFPLIVPPTLPLWMVGLGAAFGVFFGKELFGGTGRNPFNPALVGRCFLALGYPVAMTSGWVKPGWGGTGRLFQYVGASATDAISAATPLVEAKQGVLAKIQGMYLGSIGGCVGETSAILVIAGGLFLLFTKVANWRTVVAVLLTAFVAQALFHRADSVAFAPAIWHLGAGGLLFGAFFMATDPVTSPATNAGKWLYGGLIGTVTILIRNLTGYVEGVMFAILLGNIVAPLLDHGIHLLQVRRLAHER